MFRRSFPLLFLLSLGLTGYSQSEYQRSPAARSAIESYRRQDWTGRGTYHRLGIFREQENTQKNSAETVTASGVSVETTATDSRKNVVPEVSPEASGGFDLSIEAHANTMLFRSDNILNTELDPIPGSQFAEFLGTSIDLKFGSWTLTTGFDQAFFRFLRRGSLTTGDFNTSTIREQLSYEKFLYNNKVSMTISPVWQYTKLTNRGTGKGFFEQANYGLNQEFSWFAADWLIPTFSYNFSYLDADPPDEIADKTKHDFNLGLTIIPMKGTQFFISPSVQFSTESNIGVDRRDNAWTPTLSLTYQPCSFLAADLVGSYTDSDSTQSDSSFTALTGTFFVRAFFRW